ncbi:MAG: hypothetical protein H6779_05465 [Candidatus Nomurabacteria bacterium]|nr:MAG: hypothetical protein H6779_05465 [Candidatus Nomurabacteria bacterium]
MHNQSISWFYLSLSIALVLSLSFLSNLLLVEAADEVLFSQETESVSNSSSFISPSIDASDYSELEFSFTYDSTKLDFGPPQDSFSYGYSIGGQEFVLGTVLGLAGSSTDEHGIINTLLPPEAAVPNMALFIKVEANSGASSDKVVITNISLQGTAAAATDMCPNIEGNQAEVPAGYEVLDGGDCQMIEIVDESVDLCPNLDGLQEVVPDGYELVDNICTIDDLEDDSVVEPVSGDDDEGTQDDESIVDEGEKDVDGKNQEDEDGQIGDQETEESDGVSGPSEESESEDSSSDSDTGLCPPGYAKWVDRLNGGSFWQADDVYQSVILVGRGHANRRNYGVSRHVYIPGPTEVGDRYYNRFARISHVCVR